MRNAKGFTLIELLIVIAIILVLAAVLVPNLSRARQRANLAAAQSYVRNVVTAVEANRNNITGAVQDSGSCTNVVGNMPAAISSCTITTEDSSTNFKVVAQLVSGGSITYQSSTGTFSLP